MFDLVVHKVQGDPAGRADRELLYILIEKVRNMAVDLSKLQAAADRVAKAIDALATHANDPATQAALDAVSDALNSDAQKAENAVNVPSGG